MDAGTVIAIVVSNIVAVIAIVFGGRLHGRELRHGRQLADLESIRTVLDQAATALHTTAYAHDRVRVSLTQHDQDFFDSAEGANILADVEGAGKQLDGLLERLKVRLGAQHEVVVAFEGADTATLEIFRALKLIKLKSNAVSRDEFARRQIEGMFDKHLTRIEGQRSVFDSQRAKFIDAAHHTAGAELPPNT